MENDQNIKNSSQSDITNKSNTADNDTNNTFNEKNSDEFRHQDKHQKIKINEQKLKNTKEKVMEIKSETNKDQSNINEDMSQKNNNNLYIHERKYYFRINRCLKGNRKKMILIISSIISAIFLFVSIADLINSIKNNIYSSDKLLINNRYIFIIQIIYIFSLLIFLILIIISERKDNFVINLIFLMIICGISIIKIFLYVKKFTLKQITIVNFLICFCLTLINLIILLITLRIIKMKKNEQQNIEEIINFTDIPQGIGAVKINERKDNQLILNNSETDNRQEFDSKNKKDGMTDLVEEINKNEISNEKSEQEQK